MRTNQEIRSQALDSLKGNWPTAIGVFLVGAILTGGLHNIPGFGNAAAIILGGPITLGLAIFSLSLARRKEARFDQLFEGFNDFGRALGAYFLVTLIIAIGFIFLIVPGIYFALVYSQTFFIMADDPDIGISDAMSKSKIMMEGHKEQLFFLGLTFFGLGILSIFTLFIGLLFLMPYAEVSYAIFHDEIDNSRIDKDDDVEVL